MSKSLRFLIYGDVFGKRGRRAIVEEAGKLKKKYKPDFIIANVENLTHGAGINPQSIEDSIIKDIKLHTLSSSESLLSGELLRLKKRLREELK